MSRPAPGAAELDQALEGLGAIAALTGEGHEAFRSSPDRRLALAFLWVTVGSALKQFCRARGISQGSSPFPGLLGAIQGDDHGPSSASLTVTTCRPSKRASSAPPP